MDERMETMCRALKQLGMEVDVSSLPELDSCTISSTGKEPNDDETEKIETN
jgi:hypothetical protein